ncbi:MAG: Bcr/CflA family drug resistance efflux transporter [Rhodobacterales bacterium]|nr:MAG: Bcr/CflA family drug resistance efflux transporter [Rhodobacterales bacterium]
MPTRTAPSLATLILLTSISVLALNMFLPALDAIASDLNAPYTLVSLSLGGYLALSALLQLVLGPLSDRYGRRPVMLWGMAVFTIASLGSALAVDVWSFLAFRMVQCVVGAGMVLSRAVVRDTAPPEEAARILALIGTVMALAPLLGPILGGALTELFGWRANFHVFALMGAVVFVLTWADLGETNLTPSASFGAQFKSYPELVRSGLFWAYCACLVFSVGGFYAFLGGAPLVGARLYGLGPGALGLGMGMISAGFMVGNIVSSRLMRRRGSLILMIWGRWVATLGPLVAMFAILAGVGHPVFLFGGAIFVGFGNGLTLPGANAGVLSVAPHLAGSAAGLSAAVTVAGGAALTAIAGWGVTGAFGAEALLILMAATSGLGLVAALAIRRIEARG